MYCYIEINRTVFIFLHVFLHTNLPSCPLYFLNCYIERNKLIGQEDEVLYAIEEEAEIQSSKRYTNSDSKSNTQNEYVDKILDYKMLIWEQWGFVETSCF
jgi:hypothetical protein